MAPTPFQNQVYRHMLKQRIEVRRILRVYPPSRLNDMREVLFVTKDDKPGTVFVDMNGEVICGPFEGFGIE